MSWMLSNEDISTHKYDDIKTDIINELIGRGETHIVLKPGRYLIKKSILIRGIDYLFITGSTGDPRDVEIIFTDDMDGIIVKNCNHFCMKDLTIALHDTENSEQVGTNLTIKDCDHFIVSNCIFDCAKRGDGYGIKILGSGVMLDRYLEKELCKKNIFLKNTVYCTSSSGVQFNLQYKTKFIKNTVNGCKLDISLCKKCEISDNVFENSHGEAVSVNLPCYKLKLCSNKVYDPYSHGIVVDGCSDDSDKYKIEISDNWILYQNNPIDRYGTIPDNTVGILLNCCKTVNVKHNYIYTPKGKGIVLRGDSDTVCENNKIRENCINMKINKYKFDDNGFKRFFKWLHWKITRPKPKIVMEYQWPHEIEVNEFAEHNKIKHNYIRSEK